MQTLSLIPNSAEIQHFAWVEPWLARSAHPKPAGYACLADHDFRVVVNLRQHDQSAVMRRMTDRLEPVHIFVKDNRAPTHEQALQWLDICAANHPMGRILVHCGAGEGRTSTFCGLVRIAQGWTWDDAIAEQRTFGFQPEWQHKEQAIFLAEFYSNAKSGVIAIPRLM